MLTGNTVDSGGPDDGDEKEEELNVIETEQPSSIIAKMCGCKKGNITKKVTYSFVDSYHGLFLDKRDIIFEELNACERLLKYPTGYNICMTKLRKGYRI